MNKAELIEIAAKEADISKAAAGKALDGIMAAVVKAVSKGDTVTLVGFGTFKSAKRSMRDLIWVKLVKVPPNHREVT